MRHNWMSRQYRFLPNNSVFNTMRKLYALSFVLIAATTASGQFQTEPAAAAKPSAPPGSSPPAFKVEADPSKAAKEEPPTEAEKFIDQAVKKVQAIKSVSADITQTAEVLGQKFELKGQYLKDVNNKVRLQLTLNGMESATGTMLQVCDGVELWDVQQVIDSQSYRKRKIGEIMTLLNDPRMDATIREQIIAQLGFAGPEALLTGLRKSIKFDNMSEDSLDGQKVIVVQGEWKDRSALTAPGQAPLPMNAPLPAYVPSIVRAWIGKENGWPYQIRLVGRAPSEINLNQAQIGPDGRPIRRPAAGPKVVPSAITLAYSNVKLNPTLKPEQFAFTAPPSMANQVADDTQVLVTQLTKFLEDTEARKRAAGVADSSLKQSIPIPKPAQSATEAPAPLPPTGAPDTKAAQPAPTATPKPKS